MASKRFDRGLTDGFVEELGRGRFAALVRLVGEGRLDLQIRRGSINLYFEGQSVLRLDERTRAGGFRAVVHRKYLEGVSLPGATKRDRDYVRLDVGDGFVDAYLRQLPAIIENTRAYVKPEGQVEDRIVSASRDERSNVIILDRQVQVPGIKRRMDMLGIDPARRRVLLVELKQGLDNRIQHLMQQIGGYHEALTAGGALRPDVASSYRRVIEQKQSLALLPRSIALAAETRVECLLILSGYNPRSELLDRLREGSRGASIPVWLVQMPAGAGAIPVAGEWERLG